VELITTTAAARRAGLTRGTIWHLIRTGFLPASRLGNRYYIDAVNMRRLRSRPKPGRPAGNGHASGIDRTRK
jgi:excisionase family DNA binding protein